MLSQAENDAKPSMSEWRIFSTMPISSDIQLAAQQRAYVKFVMERLTLDMTHLARLAKVHHSTLSRFMTGGREGHVLRHSTINKIRVATGIEFSHELAEAGQSDRPPAATSFGFAETEASPFRREINAAPADPVAAALAGRNNVDAWVLRSRALEGLGYRPGDVLVVALGESPRPGDIVCLQIYDFSKGLAETVFRLYRPPAFIAVSGDEKLLRPYGIDDNSVVVKGVVLHTVRSRATAA